jgi:hypothetical protein
MRCHNRRSVTVTTNKERAADCWAAGRVVRIPNDLEYKQVGPIKIARTRQQRGQHGRVTCRQPRELPTTFPAIPVRDRAGEIIHTWCMPYPAVGAYLTERGTLVYNGRTGGPEDSSRGSTPWNGGVLLEVDWTGEVVWEVRHPDHHDDGIRLANGNALLLCMADVPREIGKRVAGGLPGSTYKGRAYDAGTNDQDRAPARQIVQARPTVMRAAPGRAVESWPCTLFPDEPGW